MSQTPLSLLVLFVCTLSVSFSPLAAIAASYSFEAPPSAYAVVALGSDVETRQEVYGRLMNEPILYEIIAVTPSTLTLTLSQYAEVPTDLRLLVVRALEGGQVETVARMFPDRDDWLTAIDRGLGVRWYVAPTYTADLSPGTYRLEVSSPTNNPVVYQLQLGETDTDFSYRATWGRLLAVNEFLDRSIFALRHSYFVLAHVMIGFLVLATSWYLWHRRHLTLHHD
jgi:hypothetical protein